MQLEMVGVEDGEWRSKKGLGRQNRNWGRRRPSTKGIDGGWIGTNEKDDCRDSDKSISVSLCLVKCIDFMANHVEENFEIQVGTIVNDQSKAGNLLRAKCFRRLCPWRQKKDFFTIRTMLAKIWYSISKSRTEIMCKRCKKRIVQALQYWKHCSG